MNTPPINFPSLSSYLTVANARKAIEFYQAAFGATELFRLLDPSTGAVGHAEILIDGSLVMLADENPAWGNKSPLTLGGSAVTFCLVVKDTDAAVARATAAGAAVEMPPTDMFYGFRSAAVIDPFGHKWMLQHEIEKVSPEAMQERWNAMAAAASSPDGGR